MIQTARIRNDTVTRNSAIGWFHTDNAIISSWFTYTVSGIGTDGKRYYSTSNQYCTTSGTASGNTRCIPRIINLAGIGILIRSSHAQLIHRRFGDDNRTGFFQFFTDMCIIYRNIVIQYTRAGSCSNTLHIHIVF